MDKGNKHTNRTQHTGKEIQITHKYIKIYPHTESKRYKLKRDTLKKPIRMSNIYVFDSI